jgi:CelD/BcsL family acetyltransferase involved in cellulose biosynthesis
MATDSPSLFGEPAQRLFYRRLCERLSASGWLRFTRLCWQGRPIAFHFGFLYSGNFLWYKPSFDILLARHSPGEVLIRQLLLLALEEGAHTFDFGLGNEAFKQRFATATPVVKVYGLYHKSITAHAG